MARAGTLTAVIVLSFWVILHYPFPAEGAFVREPAWAGSFYPSNAEELTGMIRGLMEEGEAVPLQRKRIAGIIAPHAGYVYSGRTAARAYREIRGNRYDLVVLLGPSHFLRVQRAAIMLEGAFRTPLGQVKIDSRAARDIQFRSPGLFESSPALFVREHSLEVQLPFLQVALGDFSFVPIEVNVLERRLLEKVADAIFSAVQGKRVLVVASTDLSHYKSRGAGRALDEVFRERVQDLDDGELIRDLKEGKCEACGGAASVLALMLWKRLGAASVYITGYADSGDTTGDTASVVGYLSAIALKSGEKTSQRRGKMKDGEPGGNGYLSEGEKKELLAIARKTISEFVQMGNMPDVEVSSEKLKAPGAAFVTIEKGGKLRGCIGYTKALYPLYRTIMECAVSSATDDPRFPPIAPSELASIRIEISVLTPLEKVEDLSGIEVGRHGLMVSKGHNRGLLLPQVAVKNGWDVETFLSQTCVKAGLPSLAWKKEVDIYTFEAEIFGDDYSR